MSAPNPSSSDLDLEAAVQVAPVTAVWTAALAVVCLRAGSLLGLWPVAMNGSGTIDRANVTALVVHGGGALAVVGFFLARNKAGCLIGLAYTGYSTIALGLTAPRVGLGVVIWGLGVLTMTALGWALMREPLGQAVPDLRRTALTAVVTIVLGAAAMTALVLARI